MTTATPELPTLRVGMLGCGTVGSQVARIITQQHDDLAARTGAHVELVAIAVRDASKDRPGIDPALFTQDAAGLVARDDLDIIIELIGGVESTRELVATALSRGTSVVTANKALLAAHGAELTGIANQTGADLYYEAAVAGAIPILRPLRESLVGDEITMVMGIVNGTTNYILDQMTTTGADFDDALAQAQGLGYAEADPTADIEGHDAAAKAAILASLAFHTRVSGDQVFCEGISHLTAADIEAVTRLGFVLKLLAVAQLTPEDQVSVRVHPVILPNSHPLSSVHGAYNAIFVESREAGRLMFMGPGAGGAPTASAVMGDLVTVARNRKRGVAGHAPSGYTDRVVAPMGGTECLFYLRFDVDDKPGVLAQAASVFSRRGVSLQTVSQIAKLEGPAGHEQPLATLGIMTHETQEQVIQECVAELQAEPFLHGEVRLLRVEGMA
ncbi:homoserine dehydrogenase [Propionibacteriaceae bacterium Y1923]|uniref:homoserine dehydrogenase n=1 Tax=Aestuariimicrobium sp. Y1814 TaxID=3418742 RepID=UPI003C195943